MTIKDEFLDLILNDPKHFAAVFLLYNQRNCVELSGEALHKQLKSRYKVAKQSLVIVEYLRSQGYQDSEIFEI